MPYYNYTCKDCGYTFSESRPSTDRQTPTTCKECGGEANRDWMGQIAGGSWGSISPYKTTE